MRVGFAIPGPIATAVSGGYIYDRALIARAPAFGVTLEPIELPGRHPLAADDAAGARAVSDALDAWDGPLLIDGLALGAFPPELSRRIGPRTVALVHHPLIFEREFDAPERRRLQETESAALAAAKAIVVTSETTAEALEAFFAAPRDKIAVAPPGFDRAPRAPLAGRPPIVLSVGAVIERKRVHAIVDALGLLGDLDWRHRHIGPLGADAAATAALEASLAAARARGLGARFEIAGALAPERVAQAYLEADLFVSAAIYEGYGMAIAEAALRGAPIVAVGGGAARETAAAGTLVEPVADAAALAASLARAMRPLLSDRAARQTASDAVWATRGMILTPEETTDRVVSALRRVFGEGR